MKESQCFSMHKKKEALPLTCSVSVCNQIGEVPKPSPEVVKDISLRQTNAFCILSTFIFNIDLLIKYVSYFEKYLRA